MRRLPLSLLCAVALASAARAELTAHAVAVDTTLSPIVAPVEFPRFDPALGTLDEVRIDLLLRTTGGVGFENLSSEPVVVTTSFGAGCALRTEGGATLVTAASRVEATRIYSPFDGRVDFAGRSGALDLGLEVEAGSSFTATGDPYWVSGVAAQSPTIELDLVLANLTRVDAHGRHVVRHGQDSEVEVSISYTYTPHAD